MSTVTIGVETYEIYGTLAAAKKYLGPSANAAAWNALATDDLKESALVNATRLLDRQLWKGAPVGVPAFDVVLQWPRTGVTDRNGVEVSSATVPLLIEQATYELAAIGAATPAVFSQANTGSNIAELQAGPAGIKYFRTVVGTRMPSTVMDLVGQFLGSDSVDASAPVAYGTCSPSEFTDIAQYNKIGPL